MREMRGVGSSLGTVAGTTAVVGEGTKMNPSIASNCRGTEGHWYRESEHARRVTTLIPESEIWTRVESFNSCRFSTIGLWYTILSRQPSIFGGV